MVMEEVIEKDSYYLTTSLIVAFSTYILFYFYKVVHRPYLIAANGEFKSMISNLPILKEHYWPTVWAFSTHPQTIFRAIFKSKPQIPYRREILVTPDDGHIGLDWVDNDQNNHQYPTSDTRPIVVVLPGITGSSDASYVRHIALESTKLGYRVLVFNNRGMGEVTLKTPRTFCACNGEDLELVLKHVNKKYPDAPMVMFAVSLGGMILSHYMVHAPDEITRNIKGTLVVSCPWDASKSSASLERPINRFLYNRFLTAGLRELVKTNWKVLQENMSNFPYKLENVMRVSTIREFDEQFTSKMFGFSTNDDYYDESSLSKKPLENIKVPMLFLNARDDPFAPPESIPFEKIKQNKNIAMVLTDYGGHIGFIEGILIRNSSFVERLFSQYVSKMLVKNNNH